MTPEQELADLRARWDALKDYLNLLLSGPGRPGAGEWERGYDRAVSDILKELKDADVAVSGD